MFCYYLMYILLEVPKIKNYSLSEHCQKDILKTEDLHWPYLWLG